MTKIGRQRSPGDSDLFGEQVGDLFGDILYDTYMHLINV
jgi:hypothetical protein